jgi:hypothetical protein
MKLFGFIKKSRHKLNIWSLDRAIESAQDLAPKLSNPLAIRKTWETFTSKAARTKLKLGLVALQLSNPEGNRDKRNFHKLSASKPGRRRGNIAGLWAGKTAIGLYKGFRLQLPRIPLSFSEGRMSIQAMLISLVMVRATGFPSQTHKSRGGFYVFIP